MLYGSGFSEPFLLVDLALHDLELPKHNKVCLSVYTELALRYALTLDPPHQGLYFDSSLRFSEPFLFVDLVLHNLELPKHNKVCLSVYTELSLRYSLLTLDPPHQGLDLTPLGSALLSRVL